MTPLLTAIRGRNLEWQPVVCSRLWALGELTLLVESIWVVLC